jgi:hypothetical protein
MAVQTDSIGIGDWQCDREPPEAVWASLQLIRFNASWAYSAGVSLRRIVSLELFTTLQRVKLTTGGTISQGPAGAQPRDLQFIVLEEILQYSK